MTWSIAEGKVETTGLKLREHKSKFLATGKTAEFMPALRIVGV
jgi:hypothetical protein